MNHSTMAAFVSAYTDLVMSVWADPAVDRRLTTDPVGTLAEFGLFVPDGVELSVTRDSDGTPGDLRLQAERWVQAADTGSVVVVVPHRPSMTAQELDEDELLGVVGGISTSCACCCPCCCA